MAQRDQTEEPRDSTLKNIEQSNFDYGIGLNRLLNRLGQNHPRYSEALVYQQRLMENIKQSQLHGDSQTLRAERSQIIDQLNQLALSTLDTSFLELCYPSPPPSPPPPPSFDDFTFQDREDLCKEILQSKANHIELYGPCGVGKTYVLRDIAKEREGIRGVYINLTAYPNIADVLPEVVRQLTGARPQPPVETRDFAMAIRDLYNPETRLPVKHFVFLFDSAEDEKHCRLINWLISRDGLINNEELFRCLKWLDIRQEDVKLQVVIAARRPVVKVEGYHPNFHFDRIRIDRLVRDPDSTEDAIQGMLRELAEHKGFPLTDANCQEVSDEIYFLTGGHPKCAKSVLFAVANVSFMPTQNEYKSFFEGIVLPTIEGEMLCSIPDALVSVFRVLSGFRRFDQRVLATLMDHGTLEPPAGVEDTSRQARRLRRRLVDTYLISEPTKDEPMFTMNFAVRRALSLRMRYQSPERYRAINQTALAIFENWLQHTRTNPDRSVISLIEIVHHRLKALETDPQVRAEAICELIRNDPQKSLQAITLPMDSQVKTEAILQWIGGEPQECLQLEPAEIESLIKNPKVREEAFCEWIRIELRADLQRLLQAIDEDDWSTHLPRLKDYWDSDEELRETTERVVGNGQCYEALSHQIELFVADKMRE